MNYVHHEKGKGYARLVVFNLGDIVPPSGRSDHAQGGEKNGGGDRAVTKNIDVSVCLICEDSMRPEFGRQNQPRGNSSIQSSYAPVY